MKKTITIDLREYENILLEIKELEKFKNDTIKSGGVFYLDYIRREGFINRFGYNVIRIPVVLGFEAAKDFMQKEFRLLSEEVDKMDKIIESEILFLKNRTLWQRIINKTPPWNP